MNLSLLEYLSIVFNWISKSYIEILATITGFIYLYYSIKVDKRLWVYGFVTSALYVYVCYVAGIYADMGINIYYVLVSVYAWIHWTFYRNENKSEIPITRTKPYQFIAIIIVTVFFYLFIAFVLVNYTNSSIPYWDAFTTSASITATWMLARKMIEHWIIWVVVDAVSIGLYAYKELYSTVLLFFVYTIMAIIGFIQWRKQWIVQKIN